MPIPVRVVSVERSLFEGEADFILARSTIGELGVLPRHAPLLAVLAPGELRVDKTGGGSEVLFVGGGFMEVLPDRVTVLADVAERADEINLERAEQTRRSVQERLAGQVGTEERVELEQALARAEARLRLARIRRGGG
ncbi:MAG: ATP synthase F1 subunit epsilon [Chloroflexi bacterium]|nr:MAG: ATP synthase F1 subunit epsilon [Chloroflexota bacterium]TME16990.1 MAG: ATP synthase F1 subunit epsilon [Chloroflexota bacterium]TME19415.1 MAG: ATP synthase F1 subunit epsilon [Chloroflexota bacterium]